MQLGPSEPSSISRELSSLSVSSKEKLRPGTTVIRVSKSTSSEKERFMSESTPESDEVSEVTMGSEKEYERQETSSESEKEIPSESGLRYIEASSFGSAKEEFQEKSYGSSKEFPASSSREFDLDSPKIRYIEEREIEPEEIEIFEESSEGEPTFKDIEGSSEKEVYAEELSSGSEKEALRETTLQSSVLSSAKDIFEEESLKEPESEEISPFRKRYDPYDPEREYQEILSFGSDKSKYVEITSSSEWEMDTRKSLFLRPLSTPLSRPQLVGKSE